jgi:hypothetical protein
VQAAVARFGSGPLAGEAGIHSFVPGAESRAVIIVRGAAARHAGKRDGPPCGRP